MAFNEQEQEIIKSGVRLGKTRQEVEVALRKYRSGYTPTISKEEPSLVKETLGDVVDTASSLSGNVRTAAKIFQEAEKRTESGKQSRWSELLQKTGAAGSALSKSVGDLFVGAGKAILPQSAEETVKEKTGAVVGAAVSPMMELDGIRSLITEYEYIKENDPVLAENLKGALGVVEAALLGASLPVGGAAKSVVQKGVQTAGNLATENIDDAARAIKEAAKAVSEKTQGATDIVKMAGENLARKPEQIATNLAARKAQESAISALPTKIAQTAVRDGVDIGDVDDIYKIAQTAKPQTKETAKNVAKSIIDFAGRKTKADPIESVGKPIVAKLKELNKQKGIVGQKLGEVAKNLGIVTKEEITAPVFNSLKEVPGLSGLTVDKNGILNFKNTVLTTKETLAERKAIQSIYAQATKWGNGEAKHRLRQELFEILGGKKKSLTLMTDTQDRAYQAIRKGISDVLETKNTQYKALSNQYREIVAPLADMRKMMQAIPDVSEDILEMNAGMLARRLTSTAMSRGRVSAILDAMDKSGVLRESTEVAQDVYNILSRYYNIAPKTGFQGSVKAGVESAAGGVSEAVVGAIKGIAGETDAVRSAAIEKVLKEALGL